MIIMVTGVTRFKRCTGILVSRFRGYRMLSMTVNAFRCCFFRTSGMWNPYVRIYGTAIRLSLNIFLNQFVKCRSVTGQALLFFHCFGCILSKYGTG